MLNLFKQWSRRVCGSLVFPVLLFPLSVAANSSHTFDVLSYNIFMRPYFLDGQRTRTDYLVAQLAGYDAIVFQEAYDDRIRDLLLQGLIEKYPFSTRVLGYDTAFEQDGGVIIISKWPILREAQRVFTVGQAPTTRCPGPDCCESFDCYADKGVVYAKINKAGRCYHLFGTHLQAGSENWKLRNEQLKVISDFVASRRIVRGAPVIIAGDLNVDRSDRARFANMQSLLAAVQPPLRPTMPRTQGGIFTFDGPSNDLNEEEDVRQYVDYVLYSIEYLTPVSAYNQVRVFRASEAWRHFFWHRGRRDLSDHYAVLGHFVYTRGADSVRACP